MNNLDDMLLFAQVVKMKSFRAVAEQRGVASSVVSKHISRLEKHLGVAVADPHHTKVEPYRSG